MFLLPTFQWPKQVTCPPSSTPMKEEAQAVSKWGGQQSPMAKDMDPRRSGQWGMVVRLTTGTGGHAVATGAVPCALWTRLHESLTEILSGRIAVILIFQ